MSFFINDNSRLFKAVAIGVMISAAFTAILLCVCTVILNYLSGIPYDILGYLTAACLCVSVFFGAYIAAAIAKSRGLLVGLLVAAIVLSVILALGLSLKGESVGILTVIRSVALPLFGALGGIRGVNRKEHIHIK